MKFFFLYPSIGCGVAHWVVRRLALSAGHSSIFGTAPQREVFPIELTSDEEMKRNISEWRRMNVPSI
jgi:hypothetical protein